MVERFDVLIIAPLGEEFDALNKLLDLQMVPGGRDRIRIYHSAVIQAISPYESIQYKVIVTQLLDKGLNEASDATREAIALWDPRYIILVGIAGGIAEAKVQLGDLLLANMVVNPEEQKLTPGNISIRWRAYTVDPSLYAMARAIREGDWVQAIRTPRPESGNLVTHFGPVCTSNKVVADDSFTDELRKAFSQLIGVEMEAGGVAYAAHHTPSKPGFLMVRGVSDLADAEKGTKRVEEWRRYACDVAATFTVHFLRTWALQSAEVSIEAVDEAVKELLAAATVPMGAAPTIQLSCKSGLSRTNRGIAKDPWRRSRAFKLGETMEFFIELNEPGWVRLFVVQSDGVMINLFPDEHQPNYKINTPCTLKFPDAIDQFTCVAKEPVGSDVAFAVWAKEPFDLFADEESASINKERHPGSNHALEYAKTVHVLKRLTGKVKEKIWRIGAFQIDIAP